MAAALSDLNGRTFSIIGTCKTNKQDNEDELLSFVRKANCSKYVNLSVVLQFNVIQCKMNSRVRQH